MSTCVHVSQGWLVASLAVAALGSAAGEQRAGAGWLGRLIAYYKNSFFDDFKQLAPVNLQASIEKAPSGYVDSPSWDFESVARLLGLLRADKAARPVRRVLRRALGASGPAAARRFMDREKSYKFFPSLADMHMSDLYYDAEIYKDESSSEEQGNKWNQVSLDEAVVRVANPVEARLPAAHISVNLLKEILEARALAARKMPPPKTTPSGITWTTEDTSEASSSTATAPAASEAGNDTAPAGAAETTPPPAPAPPPPDAGAGNATTAASAPAPGGNTTAGNGTTN